MLTYCVKYGKKPGNLNSKILLTKSGIIIMQSKRAVCGSKKSRFVKEQKAKALLSSLGLKIPLNKIPLFSNILF